MLTVGFLSLTMQRLDDPRVSNLSFNGKIVCHIPEVEETTSEGAR